ncbi:anthranilate phosphoribosyltransferase [Recurvomyces mirabilis]|nr:anthranilate phosphoribosyltransferase [Recurvomyces mirabilis]
MATKDTGFVSVTPLLKRLSTLESARQVQASEIAAAVGLIFDNRISPIQFALLLWALHTTGQDHSPEVLAACAASMRGMAAQVDVKALRQAVSSRSLTEGHYAGGLCDIVGTGGDGHDTYNVSTTSSIIASAVLMMAKHGNNSSTSLSGSADLLQHVQPKAPVIAATTAQALPGIYEKTNYAFLYAREWHPGMKYAAAVRKEVPVRTIFNLLGPLANPVHDSGLLEARILGVARKDIGAQYAEALRLSGATKALVVCGDENLDEISCAGPTHCWYVHETGGMITNEDGEKVKEVRITELLMSPEDFGLPRHPLSEVHGGKGPAENAQILMKILRNELPENDPVLHFVLLNTAALITVSGICEAETSSMGEGDDGVVVKERGSGGLRWREGLRRARWCIESGAALRQWEGFVDATNALSSA